MERRFCFVLFYFPFLVFILSIFDLLFYWIGGNTLHCGKGDFDGAGRNFIKHTNHIVLFMSDITTGETDDPVIFRILILFRVLGLVMRSGTTLSPQLLTENPQPELFLFICLFCSLFFVLFFRCIFL